MPNQTPAFITTDILFSSLVKEARNYAVYTLDLDGRITSWNSGAERLLGYADHEAIGQNFSIFYSADDITARRPAKDLENAQRRGTCEASHWRVRKDGTKFWGQVVIAAIHDGNGKLLGFSEVTRVHPDAATQETEERWRVLLDSIPQIVWTATPDGRQDYANQRWYEFNGVEPSKAEPEPWRGIIHPDDVGPTADCWKRALETGDPYSCLHRNRRHDGEYRWVLSQAVPERDKQGRIVRWIGTGTDITALKKAEEALRESEERLARTQEFSLVMGLHVSLEGEWLKVPPTFCKMLGYTEQELLCRPFKDFTHPDDFAEDWRQCQQLIRGEIKSFEMEKRFLRKDGSIVWVYLNCSVVSDQDGKPVHFLTYIRDITAQKRAELALQQSEASFRALSEAIPQMVWTADPDGTNDYYNSQWYQYTGLSLTETQGWGWTSAVHPDDLQMSLDRWNRSIKTGQPYEIEYRFKRAADGLYRWHLGRAVPIRDRNDQIVKWFGTCTDIHDQKEALERAKIALDARDEFLSIASHELKTPITALKLQLEIAMRTLGKVAEQPGSSQRVIKTLGSSDRQLNRLTRLVEDLLDVSRIQAGKLSLHFEQADLSAMVQEVADKLAEQAKLASTPIELDLQPDVYATCDAFRMEQVVFNLLGNSIKYAPGKPIRVTLRAESDETVLSVRDFGPGIDKKQQAKIFERFERAIDDIGISGLGLGLFIVDQIVKGHGGAVHVESDPGRGALFVVRIPREPHEVLAANA